jgi:hypothetical protein
MSHLTISRQAEYFSVKELQLMTGRPERDFGNVIVKELLDNALDAAETIGIKPIIALDIDEIDNRLIITVADNGGGIPADLINKIVDFNTRTSDKVARRLPSRGAQGNAIKTILGIPVALGGGHVAIESHNLKHLIKPSILPGGDVDIQVITQDTDWALGTRVTVNMPVINVSSHWQLKFELFNPHITFVKNCELQNEQLPCSIEHQKNCDFYKIWPDEPTSVHWYTFEAFFTLLHLTGRQADKPLGEYIRLFKGLTDG